MLRAAWAVASLVCLVTAPSAAADSAAPPANVRYQLGLLVRGPAWTPERTPRTDSLQAGHMANIGRMWDHGALLVAGPFEGGGEMRGVFVFRPGDDPLDSLMAGDSAIAARRLECRLYPWLAPPGLGEEYRRRQQASEGQPDSMVSFGWVLLQRGPHFDSSASPRVRKLLARHDAYAQVLRASGRLVFSGAIEGADDLHGVLVMRGDSAEVATAVAADPAVRAGRFTPRILRWWTAWGTIPGH